MLKEINHKIIKSFIENKLIIKSNSLNNIFKLFSGSLVSQSLSIIAAPILSRLYGPAVFGIIALYVSGIALIDTFSTFRYELAIVVPKKEIDAINLAKLCFLITTIFTFFLIIFIFTSRSYIENFFYNDVYPIIYFVPISIFLNGINKPLKYLAIRNKDFGNLAKMKVLQNLFSNGTKILFYTQNEFGILLGQFIDNLIFIIKFSKKYFHLLRKKFGVQNYIKKAISYKDYGIISSFTGVINAFSMELPTLILASNFDTSRLGIFYLVQKLILFPTGLISEPISDVFLSDIAIEKDTSRRVHLFNNYSKNLFKLGIIYSIAIFIFSPLIPFLLGSNWNESPEVANTLIPIAFAQTCLAPLGSAFLGARIINQDLVAQINLIIFKNIPLLIALKYSNFSFLKILWIYSLFSLFGYVAYYFILNLVCLNCQKVLL